MAKSKDFANNLNKAIENSGLSVPKLAIRLGLNHNNIYKWQKGAKPSDPEEYKIITKWITENLENVPRGIEQGETPKIEMDANILMQAVLNLSESNKILAINNQKLVDRLGPN